MRKSDKKMIAFRADVNQYTATGHMMRCMSIADRVLELGGEVVFIVSDDIGAEFVRARGFSVEILHSDWRNMEKELPTILQTIRKLNPSWLVISSYQTTSAYFETLRTVVPTMHIDDVNKEPYTVTALLNYNIYAERLPYSETYNDRDTRLLLGTRYAPLRSQFEKRRVTVRDQVKNILISTGGTDRYGMVQSLLDCFARDCLYGDIHFHIIRGAFAEPVAVPKSLHDRVTMHQNVVAMADLMQENDLAITAGGSTYYELCACGIPSVSYALSDDQYLGAQEFDRLGLIPYCGDIRADKQMCIKQISSAIQGLLLNRNRRSKIAEKMQKFVDGEGAKRVALVLLNKQSED